MTEFERLTDEMLSAVSDDELRERARKAGIMRDAAADLAICEAATPEPWEQYEDQPRMVAGTEEYEERSAYARFGKYQTRNICTIDGASGSAMFQTEEIARFVATAREALPYWIREAQAWEERAERAEKEREAVIKLVLDNYSFCPVDVVCLGENGPSCRECLETAIRKQLAQEVGKDERG